MYTIRRQPFKLLFKILVYLGLFLIKIPWWSIRYLLPSFRPRRTFTLGRTMVTHLLKYTSLTMSNVLEYDPAELQNLKSGPGMMGVWVEGTPQLITGKIKTWADEAGVKAVQVPGYWIHKDNTSASSVTVGEKPSNGEKVIYCIHGGGFYTFSARPDDMTSNIPRGMLQHCKDIIRSFSIEYRLSSTDPLPSLNCFPAAILDVIAGYNYLVNVVGFFPQNVIVTGDSAGANLAIALARYLIENDIKSLPLPGSLILLSPWVAIGSSHETSDPQGSSIRCKDTDYLPGIDSGFRPYARQAYLGRRDPSELLHNIYISPASLHIPSGEFQGFPRSLIVAGDAEVFLDQIRTLVKRMEIDSGDKNGHITYVEVKDSIHDFVVLGALHEPECSETLRRIADWILADL